jgi:hypothetical protein
MDNEQIIESNNHLENQVATLLGLTKTTNVLDAIEHVRTLKRLLAITEQQRKDWEDMCIRKQKLINKFEIQITAINQTQQK